MYSDKEKKKLKKAPSRFQRFRGKSEEEVFNIIYDELDWKSTESISGYGSTLEKTIVTRSKLPIFFKKFKIKRLLDIGCGDFNWMKTIIESLEFYKGTDIVERIIKENNSKYSKSNIRFVYENVLEKFNYTKKDFDAILIKDVFVHMPNINILDCLKHFKRSGIKFLIMTNFYEIEKNRDIGSFGMWRPLNFEKPPFNMNKPLRAILEESETYTFGKTTYKDKTLSIWQIN